MRLAYVANLRLPTEKAHGVQIMNMCFAFASVEGVEVSLIIPWRFNKLKAEPFEFYGLSRNFKIIRLPSIDLMPIFSGKFGFTIQIISFLISAKIYTLFKKFDAIYIRDSIVALFFKNAFFEVHNLPKTQSFFFKKALSNVKHFFPLTSFLKEDLVAFGVKENKITVASDGVDLKIFNNFVSRNEARGKLGLPLDKKIILYTGSFYLYSWKGVDILIESAKYFGNEVLFVLVGGEEKEIDEIKKKGISGNILLLSHRPHKEIPLYMFASDVLVLPNKSGDAHSERYTSPLKLFEYMAVGRPIVASRLPSICEILNDSNSVLVLPNDPKALADGLNRVLDDEILSKKIGDKVKAEALNYSWDMRAKNIINLVSN